MEKPSFSPVLIFGNAVSIIPTTLYFWNHFTVVSVSLFETDIFDFIEGRNKVGSDAGLDVVRK